METTQTTTTTPLTVPEGAGWMALGNLTYARNLKLMIRSKITLTPVQEIYPKLQNSIKR